MKKEHIKSIILFLIVGSTGFCLYYYYKNHSLEQKIEMFKVNNEAAQERAVAYMIREGKRAIPYLKEALNATDPMVRTNAAKALGRIDDKEVINPLVEVLADPDPNIRYEAMEALTNRGDMAIDALLAIAESERADIRAIAVELLGRISSTRGFERVKKALRDESPEVRAQAVIALRWISGEQAVNDILPMLKDADNNVRMMTVFALGELKQHENARRGLEKALASDDNQMREKAAHFLGESGSEDTEPALVAVLNDRELEVRWTAAEALGKIGGSAAVRALRNVLLRKNELEFVKSAARKAIENITARQEQNDGR